MKLNPIKSSSGNIKRAGYDPDDQSMVIEFSGGKKYRYQGVDPKDYAGFASTFESDDSTGSHFAKNLRNKYQGSLIKEPKK